MLRFSVLHTKDMEGGVYLMIKLLLEPTLYCYVSVAVLT